MADSPFGKPSADDGSIIIDGLNEVDTDPFWVPAGKYHSVVSGVERGTSNSDNPKIVFTFTIKKPLEVKSPDPKAIGKDLKIHAAVTPKAMWKLKATLKGLGEDVEVAQLRIQPKKLEGRECIIVVKDGELNGSKNSNIVAVLPLDEAVKKGKK